MTRDAQRSAFYDVERQIYALVDRPGGVAHTVQLAGATLTVPAEARFGSVKSVQEYVNRVLAMASVREAFGDMAPVRVRRRKSGLAAHYRRATAEIAIPDGLASSGARLADANKTWALRELVVLHELAHHLDGSGGPAHGPDFRQVLITLVGLVLGPELALTYRVLLGDAGLT